MTSLGRLLQTYGYLERMADSLRGLLRSALLAIMAVPALMGSLSTFGGAALSAPVVDGLGDRLGLNANRKAAINLMFRHTVFFINPFSATLILTANLAGVSIPDLMKVQFPLSLTMTAAAYRRLVAGVKEERIDEDTPLSNHMREFVFPSAPILLSLALTLLLGVRLIAALTVSIAFLLASEWKKRPLRPKEALIYLDVPLMMAIVFIMIFKGFVADLPLVAESVRWSDSAGIPLEPVVFIITAVLALFSGSPQAAIAVALPLLLRGTPNYSSRLLSAYFVFVISFIGYLGSPLHLCQILTNKYFCADAGAVYPEYWPVPSVTIACAMLLYLVYRANPSFVAMVVGR